MALLAAAGSYWAYASTHPRPRIARAIPERFLPQCERELDAVGFGCGSSRFPESMPCGAAYSAALPRPAKYMVLRRPLSTRAPMMTNKQSSSCSG
jgi:hypothetical protein